MTKERELVYVEWVDCYGCSPVWVNFNDLNIIPLLCRSVGWIAKEDEEVVVIVPHITQEGHVGAEFQGCGDMVIPRSAIRSIVKLTIPSRSKK